MRIRGIDVDAQSRCAHWHSDVDVVANTCGACHELWACALCHDELADHRFAPVDRHLPSVMCGACGRMMTHAEYGASCPSCGHPFNPGCKLHEDTYFLPFATSEHPR